VVPTRPPSPKGHCLLLPPPSPGHPLVVMSDSNPTQPPQTNSMVALPSTGATPASLAMTAAVPHRPVVAPASVERGVAKSGFMEKRGSLVKNWKRRFFQVIPAASCAFPISGVRQSPPTFGTLPLIPASCPTHLAPSHLRLHDVQLKEKRLEYRRKPEHRIPAGMVELLGSTCSVQGAPPKPPKNASCHNPFLQLFLQHISP